MTIPDGFEPAHFSFPILADTGPYFIKREGDDAVIGMRVLERHCQARGAAHGGVLATLADVALSFQTHIRLDPGRFVSTLSLTVNYIRPAPLDGWVEAHAVLDHLGRRNAHAHGVILHGETTLATMSGAFVLIESGVQKV